MAKREAEARLLVLDQLEGTERLTNLLRKEREDILHMVGDLAQKEEINGDKGVKLIGLEKGTGILNSSVEWQAASEKEIVSTR